MAATRLGPVLDRGLLSKPPARTRRPLQRRAPQPSAPAKADTIPLARYIFERMAQHGLDTVHGVASDFSMRPLNQLVPAKLRFIAGVNERNAGHAAEGQARVRGLGALLTGSGPAELAASGAVAGCFAEDVPLVHVVGSPPRHVLRGLRPGMYVHNTLGRGAPAEALRDVAGKFTVRSVRLDDESTAADLADLAIQDCLAWSRPVHIDVPSDMANFAVRRDRLERDGLPKSGQPGPGMRAEGARHVARRLLGRLCNASQPLILVDRGMGVDGLRGQINDLVRRSGIPTLCMPSGAGMIDNSLPNYYGIHTGASGHIDTSRYLETADYILAVGPLWSDTQTLGFESIPETAAARGTLSVMGRRQLDGSDVDMEEVLGSMLSELDPALVEGHRNRELLGEFRSVPVPEVSTTDPLELTGLYPRLNRFLRPGDIVLLGNGTPMLGGRELVLPEGARVISSGMWYSLGQMLPTAVGVAAANRGPGRTVLIDGDGNFQASAQELSTVIRERLDLTVFLVNNGGHAFRRHLTAKGLRADHSDAAPWRYLEAPWYFGAPEDYPVETYRLETWGDLDKLLSGESIHDGNGLKLVEMAVDRYNMFDYARPIFERSRKTL